MTCGVQFQHSSVITFLHLNICACVPFTTPIYPWFIFTFKHNNLSALKTFMYGTFHPTTIPLVQFQHSNMMTFLYLNIYVWVPSITQVYPWFTFNNQVRWHFCTINIYVWVPSAHHYILGSVSIFRCNDFFVLKRLCVGPLHHITIFLVQFHHLGIITILHWEHLCILSTTPRKVPKNKSK